VVRCGTSFGACSGVAGERGCWAVEALESASNMAPASNHEMLFSLCIGQFPSP
jgi:hypothetical protein